MKNWYLICFSFLLVPLMGTGVEKDLCGYIEDHREPDSKEFKQEIGPWFQKQYTRWNNAANKTNPHFWQWYHATFAPDVADTAISCNYTSLCTVVSCRYISKKLPLREQYYAYRVFESGTNFHNTMGDLRRLSSEKYQAVAERTSDLMSNFSDAHNIQLHRRKYQEHVKIIIHVAIVIALIAAAFTAWEAALITAAGGSAIAAAASWATSAEWSMAVAAGVLGSSILNDVLKPPEYVSKLTDQIKSHMGNTLHVTQTIFSNVMKHLFSGHPGPTNMTLVDIVQSGYHAKSFHISLELEKQIEQRWAASFISNIWNAEQTYIVMSKVKSGNCEQDNRAFKPLRVCLPDYPGYVFYIYFMSRAKEEPTRMRTILVRGPPGHASLFGRTNLTLTDVVQASLAHAIQVKEGADIWQGAFTPDSQIVQKEGRAAGLFSVPICYSPDGNVISSINTRKSKNYPCQCQPFPMSNTTKDEAQTTFQFLKDTGMFMSRNWYRYCRGHPPHYRCVKKKEIDWVKKFGKGQYRRLKHPWRTCKYNKHKAQGCEEPYNNGWKVNKHCPKPPKLFLEQQRHWPTGNGSYTSEDADWVSEDDGDDVDWIQDAEIPDDLTIDGREWDFNSEYDSEVSDVEI